MGMDYKPAMDAQLKIIVKAAKDTMKSVIKAGSNPVSDDMVRTYTIAAVARAVKMELQKMKTI